MNVTRFDTRLLAPVASIALALSACTTIPTGPTAGIPPDAFAVIRTPENTPGMRLYQRPPHRLFGLLQEQGGLDVVPDVAPLVAYQQQRMKAQSLFKAAPAWEPLGPDDNLGRVIDLAYHPTDPSILYASSPGGGVYKSTDGGVSWARLTALPYNPVNTIAIDPQNPDTVYFATGHFNGSGSDLLSMGVYKSTDAGASVTLLPATVPTTTATDWLRVTRIAVHPTIANRVFAGTTTGFFVSTDGGVTWTKVSSVPTYEIAIDPNNPARVIRGRFDGATSYSDNNGQSFVDSRIVPASTTTNIRTRIKHAKSTPGLVYASVDQNEGEIWKSTDGGLTWTQSAAPRHLSSQGFHTNQLWVSPIDSNHVISGGVDLYRSTNGGTTWFQISSWQQNSIQTGAGTTPNTPHADHNAVASPPDYDPNNQLFLVGTDGGLFQTNNSRTQQMLGWTKNGGNLSITQFVGGSGKRVNGVDTIVGGTQDNGTLLKVGNQRWQRIASGDGGFSVVDPTESYVFGTFQNGIVFRYGPNGFRNICTGILDSDPDDCGAAATLKLNFYSPLEIDATGRLYLGAHSLWRSTNPKATVPTWTAVKPPVTGTTSATTNSNYINAFAISQSNPDFAIVGHNDGQVFRTSSLTATTPTWAPLSSIGLPVGLMVGAIMIDPQDPNRIFIGYTGYFSNNLWRSDNGGTTWINVSAGLPPGSIYAITRHPQGKDRVFVGTIWGSYGSDNAGQTWPTSHDGPAATQVRRLFWLDGQTLVAATFGNGMFKANVPATVVTPPNTVVEYFHPVLGNYFITADPVEQAAVDKGAAGPEWQRTGGTFRAGGPSQVCRFYGNARPNPATGAIYGPNSHFYTADAAECAGLKSAQDPNAKSWFFESNDFSTTPSIAGMCPPGLTPIYRAYNNGFARGVDSNHRITADHSAILAVVAQGWSDEGIVMCAPPG